MKKVHKHKVSLHECRWDGLHAESLSYLNAKSREVYIRLGSKCLGHIVTMRIRVPR